MKKIILYTIFLMLIFLYTNVWAGMSPIITAQSSDVVTTVGSTTTFSVAVTGSSPVTYQWFSSVGGSPFTAMADQINSSRTTGALTLSNNGNQYYCVVKNAYGSAQSKTVTLTVNPVPPPGPATTNVFFQTSANAAWQETDCSTSCAGKAPTCPDDCENLKDDTDDYWNDLNGQYNNSQITQLGLT